MSPLRFGDPAAIDTYQLLARLGEGGMGTVYLARDPQGRTVAIKVIRPELVGDDHFRRRFRREVDRARQVPPFCTAEVLDADLEHDTPYLVVEYVDGPTLAEVVQQHGPLPANVVLSVAVGVATALAAIHGAGVVHRDLKPANVLIGLGMPKVIDFGIARAFDAHSELTRPEHMVGTIAYMAPERFDPDLSPSVGPAADVFAWGVVVAYAALGTTPFGSDSPMVTVGRILTQTPVLDGLPDPLRGLVAAALRKEPTERPTALQLLDSLLASHRGGPHDLARRPELQSAALAAQNAGHAAVRRRRTKRAVVVGTVLALALGAGGAVTHFAGVARSQTRAAQAQVSLAAAQTLVDESARVRATDPGLALRTAMAAQRISPGPASRAAVTAALATRFVTELPIMSTAEARFSPDGKAAVTAGLGGAVDLWRVDGPAFAHVASLPIDNDYLRDVVFSPDGRILATAGLAIRLWDVRRIDKPRLIGTRRPSLGAGGVVSFIPDGSGVIVSNGSSVSMWRLSDGELGEVVWEEIITRSSEIAANAVDPTGKIIVGSRREKQLTVWQLPSAKSPSQTPKVLTTMRDVGHINAMAFSPDGKRMALGQETATTIVDMSDPAHPKRVASLKTGPTGAVAFNANGTLLATGEERNVSLWDLRVASRTALLKGHDAAVTSVDFTPDGTRLLTTSDRAHHSVILWRVDTPWQARRGATLQTYAADDEHIPPVAFSADDTVLTGSGALTSWDVIDYAHPRGPGTQLAVKGGSQISATRASPQHRLVLTKGILWQLTGGTRARWVLPTPEGRIVTDMDPQGRLAAVTNDQGLALYRLTDAGEPVLASSLPEGDLLSAGFTTSGRSLLIGTMTPAGAPTISMWNLEDPGHPRRTMMQEVEEVPSGFATDAADHRTAFTNSESVLIWDTEHNREPITIPAVLGKRDAATSIAVSADGSVLAIGTTAGIELWSILDPATPTLLQAVAGPGSNVAFSPRRPILVTTDAREAAMWDTAPMAALVGNPMDEACRLTDGPSRAEWQRYTPQIPYRKVCV